MNNNLTREDLIGEDPIMIETIAKVVGKGNDKKLSVLSNLDTLMVQFIVENHKEELYLGNSLDKAIKIYNSIRGECKRTS